MLWPWNRAAMRPHGMVQLNELVRRRRGPALKAGMAAPARFGRGVGVKQVSTVGQEEVRSW
jgi:hypothetical protein